MKNNYGWKAGFWTAVIIAVVMSVITLVEVNGYSEAIENAKTMQEYIDDLEWDLESARTHRDRYKADLDATPVCTGAVTRIEFLEGQLDSCTRAYAEERHNRRFYEEALDDVPAYCSLGLNQFVIDGLREELNTCKSALDDVVGWYNDSMRGAPCYSDYDGIYCTWGPPTALYECAFGELGWIGPDRVMCGAFGNTSYNEARTACFSDRNCSSCIQMTGGDLGHCWAFAYYP